MARYNASEEQKFMIKESSFRRFMYQNDREKAELYYAKLANFLSREKIKKKKIRRVNTQCFENRVEEPSRQTSSPQNQEDRFQELYLPRKNKYLEEPPVYKENTLRLYLSGDKCPLENDVFTKTYSRPTNHRLYKCLQASRDSPKNITKVDRRLLSQQLERQATNQTQMNFLTFNKLLKSKMYKAI